NFVYLLNGQPLGIPVTAASAYQPTPQQVHEYWTEAVTALLVASPSNPTGTLLGEHVLRDFHALAAARGGSLIVDEIYHGLVYGEQVTTALSISDEIFVVNSFSKYFGMTGWRLGWLVAPDACVSDIDKLAQNLFLAAPTVSQHAALKAFDEETIRILESRRLEFLQRRDYLLPALRDLGFEIPVIPEGAFYLYANCRRFTDDSYRFTSRLLEEAGVAITPGIDFGTHQPETHVRFAYTTSLENLQEGVRRLREFCSSV
ncbi:MAG: aminotransferase class I/II-fold pyridoxal phosphate-dependent enzyme, partial [Gammaproteobacteria bacterium]